MLHFLRVLPLLVLTAILLPAGVTQDSPESDPGTEFRDDFKQVPVPKKWIQLSPDWKRRASFGTWSALPDGGLRAQNRPEDGHGPVLAYEGRLKNAVIECDFRLPADPGPDQHFRIFLDHPDYRGHTIAAWANLSSAFQPAGLSLLHNPKDKNKKILNEVRFGPKSWTGTSGQWHTMRLELRGDRVRVTVGELTLEGSHLDLDVEKHRIGINPGKGGGEIRNLRVTRL